jgi:outer membrane protein OmpA-like peptidoglycan-associated protein
MFSSKLVRRFAFPATLAATSLLVSGCASGPEVRADYDHSADVGNYRAYGFAAQTIRSPIGRPEFKSLALQASQNAASQEMESRVYWPSATPDLLPDFNGKLDERSARWSWTSSIARSASPRPLRQSTTTSSR